MPSPELDYEFTFQTFTDINGRTYYPVGTVREASFTPPRLGGHSFMQRDTAEAMLDYTLQHGGGTFAADGSPMENLKGFVVATIDKTYEQIPVEDPDLVVQAIMNCARDYRYHWIGTWVDSGYIHVDPVIWCATEDEAKGVARDYRQRAYFDMEKKESVYVSRRR